MAKFLNLLEQETMELIRLENVWLTTEKQALKGWKLILDQQDTKLMTQIDKEAQFSKKIIYRLTTQDSYVRGNPIFIKFTLENLSNEDLWVLEWYTPLEGLKGKIFTVTCDGKEIPYEGMMMKRGQPTKDDYVHIDPGRSVSAEVDLSKGYTLPASKECLVEFKGRIYDFSTDGNSIPKRSEEHQILNITGNAVTFSVADT
jgi:hypothetical protein